MSDVPETHRPDMGHHRLGPHVVGTRVVVRHLMPNGLANDVLGTCVAWTDDSITVDSDKAGRVTIPLELVVTGKPVPPRASVRNRATPREVEGHTLSLWPTVEVEHLGEWQLRCAPPYDGRLRRRANSALAMGDPGLTAAETSDRVVGFFTSRGRQPLVQVVVDSPEEQVLLGHGWQVIGGDAHCQLASTARAVRSCNAALRALDEARMPRPADAVPRYKEEEPRLTVDLGGMATGRAGLDGDWVGVSDLVVQEGHRRAGLATAILADLLDWGASLGALVAWLHVEVDNEPALALYEKLGFITHHTFRFLAHD